MVCGKTFREYLWKDEQILWKSKTVLCFPRRQAMPEQRFLGDGPEHALWKQLFC